MMEEPPKLSEEIHKMEREPLLPIEKKLIAWSLALGIGLLFVLLWVSTRFFSAS